MAKAHRKDKDRKKYIYLNRGRRKWSKPVQGDSSLAVLKLLDFV